jgi:tRNA threonylcarbamoyladenosine biosynthesis protein TsaE
MKFENITVNQIPEVAKSILESFATQRIFLLDAPMGAGKTTLIRALCEALGVEEEVTSPTFAIVNVYLNPREEEIYHFDFYRLETAKDALQIGFYEYLETGSYCFLEWPDLIQEHIPDEFVRIKILQKEDADLRDFEIEYVNC